MRKHCDILVLENYVTAKDNNEVKGVLMIHIVDMLKQKVVLLIIGLVILLAVVPSYYFYSKYKTAQFRLQNPTAAAAADAKELLGKIGAFMQLPTDEEPTIATVSDREKLKDQPFFANAQNGDKVLIYTQARKAILYRPATNKIIEVSTVNLGGASSATASAQVSSAKLAIYNGTSIVGLTSKAEKQLKGTIPNLEVVAKENAKKRDYEKTVVVALSPEREQEAKAIAEFLGVQVSRLPEGEVKPEAQILIILGSDYIKR